MTTWVGLDPSIAAFGYAVLAKPSSAGPYELREVGTWKTKPDAVEAKRDDRARRVVDISRKLKRLLHAHQPEVVAIESPVLGLRDGKVAVHIAGRMRGMVEGLCVGFDFAMVEFTPQEVKKSITGRSDSSKEGVAAGLHQRGYRLDGLDDNATDALAIALMAAYRFGVNGRVSSATYDPDDIPF